MKTKFTFNLKTILIVGVLLAVLFGGGFGIFSAKLNKANNELEQTVKFNNALEDSLRYTKNQLNEVKATKLTLQLSLKELNKQNDRLNNNQKELLSRINNLKDKNNLISAALVQSEMKIDSLKNNSDTVEVNKEDTSITFKKESEILNYDISVNKVVPINTPELDINSLIIPNKQFIEFKFEDKNEYNQRPVSFSISNSNPLIKTKNADSYIIPEVNHSIKPNFWDKFNNFLNKPTVKIIGGTIIFGSGVYVGATLF